MSEVPNNPTPTQELNDRVQTLLEDLELQDATEVTFASEDGGMYWLRTYDGELQAMVCRLPLETQFETLVQPHWSLVLDEVGVMQLTETLYLAGEHITEPAAQFTVYRPEEITYLQAFDLVECLMADAELVESDASVEPKLTRAQKFLRGVALSGVLDPKSIDARAVATAVAVLAT